MESRREPFRVGQQYFLPYVVNYVDNLTEPFLRCDVCVCLLEQNSLRIRMFVSKNDMPKSYHPSCFWIAMKSGSNAISVDIVQGIDQIRFEDQETLLKDIKKYNDSYVKADHVGKSMFNVMSSPTDEMSKADVLLFDRIEPDSVVLILSRMTVFKKHRPAQLFELLFRSNLESKCSQCNNSIMDNELYFIMKSAAEKIWHCSCVVDKAHTIIGSVEECGYFGMLPADDQLTLKYLVANKRKFLEMSEKIRPRIFCEINRTTSVVFLSTMNIFYLAPFSKKCLLCKRTIEREYMELCVEFNTEQCHTICLFNGEGFVIFETPEAMIGYEELPDVHKATLLEQFDSGNNVTLMTLANEKDIQRKRKAISEEEPETSEITEKIKEENIEDVRTTELRKNQLHWSKTLRQTFANSIMEATYILMHNGYFPTSDFTYIVECLVDIMMFGPPDPCPDCQSATVFYHPDTRQYCCSSARSSFSLCTFTSKNPPRGIFVMPAECEHLLTNLAGFYTNMFTERLYAGEEPSSQGNQILRRDLSHIKPLPHEIRTNDQNINLRCDFLFSNDFRIYAIKNGTSVPMVSISFEELTQQVVSDGDTVYQALLAQVDVINNVNSVIELYILESDFLDNSFSMIQRKSRSGTNFVDCLTSNFDNKDIAIQAFKLQFYLLTSQSWENRYDLCKSPFQYFFVDVVHEEVAQSGKTEMSKNLRAVLNDVLVTPMRQLQRVTTVKSQDPIFGQLSPRARNAALRVLDELQEKIEQEIVTPWDYLDATNTFYTMVPTYSGLESHKLLDTKEQIDKAYERIKVRPIGPPYELVNIYESALSLLNMNMTLIPILSFQRVWIQLYMTTTIGVTHDVDVELLDVIELERRDALPTPTAENTLMLWHGTRKSNVQGILQNGLRRPAFGHLGNGKMFGYGIYFADCFSKSVMYCRSEGVCYVLLCEVAMGRMRESTVAVKQDRLGDHFALGYKSIKGAGLHTTVPYMQLQLPEGVTVPCGPLQERNDFNGDLLYNEYIVYDENRVKLKYLCKVKVNRAVRRP